MKRKLKVLTLSEKANIINAAKNGESITSLSKKNNVAKSTICGILKKETKILECVNNTLTGPGKRKTLRTSELPKMEKALYNWFLSQRAKNYPISGLIIKEKAKELHSRMSNGSTSFFASDGWLQKFKKRYGIRLITISGEKLSARPELVEPFKIILKSKIEEFDLSQEQIYNADESALYWKLLPQKSYVSTLEKQAPGRKTEKQRLTFLACANATGKHKLKMFVIGKSKNPRVFKNFNCPVEYKNSKTAWMTSGLFKDWFHLSFVPQVQSYLKKIGLPQKALLLLDNAPLHPGEHELKSSDGLITAMFMPPNVTPLIQPMDQNAIRITKLHYRSSLLAAVFADDCGLIESIKKISLRDAVIFLDGAWHKLSQETLAKCWKPILNFTNLIEDDEDNIPLSILINQKEAEAKRLSQETVNILETLNPEITFTEDDINEWNNDNCVNEDSPIETFIEKSSSEDEDELNENAPERISSSEAVKLLTKTIQWATFERISPRKMNVLQSLREKAVLNEVSSKTRQTTITSFFSKNP